MFFYHSYFNYIQVLTPYYYVIIYFIHRLNIDNLFIFPKYNYIYLMGLNHIPYLLWSLYRCLPVRLLLRYHVQWTVDHIR